MTVAGDRGWVGWAVLDAAERALLAHGPQVSLDTVAREAGVSKGGLLHHFRTKDALLRGLCEYWLDNYDRAVARHLDPGDDQPGRWCRAHIAAAFNPAVGEGAWRNLAVQSALLAVAGVAEAVRAASRR